jgi:hypothetical protein
MAPDAARFVFRLGDWSMLQVGGFRSKTSEFSHSATNQAPDLARLNGFQFAKKLLLVELPLFAILHSFARGRPAAREGATLETSDQPFALHVVAQDADVAAAAAEDDIERISHEGHRYERYRSNYPESSAASATGSGA